MASTDQVRGWYSETVTNHHRRGSPGYWPNCDWSDAVAVRFPNQSGGHYTEPVHPATAEAWRVYVRLMEHHGVEMSSAGGVNQCRNIAGSDWPSLHAYLVACDLPPNSYKPSAFIHDVERVRTNSGAQVFLNGAFFNDRMHDQINCSQSDLATGIDPDSLPFGGDMDHTHQPPRSDLPRDWADDAWDLWVSRSGTDRASRTWDFYREDLSWVYGRVIAPLERKVDELTARVRQLENQGGGGLSEEQVKALIAQSRIVP